jgi:hypothetical protein
VARKSAKKCPKIVENCPENVERLLKLFPRLLKTPRLSTMPPDFFNNLSTNFGHEIALESRLMGYRCGGGRAQKQQIWGQLVRDGAGFQQFGHPLLLLNNIYKHLEDDC